MAPAVAIRRVLGHAGPGARRVGRGRTSRQVFRLPRVRLGVRDDAVRRSRRRARRSLVRAAAGCRRRGGAACRGARTGTADAVGPAACRRAPGACGRARATRGATAGRSGSLDPSRAGTHRPAADRRCSRADGTSGGGCRTGYRCRRGSAGRRSGGLAEAACRSRRDPRCPGGTRAVFLTCGRAAIASAASAASGRATNGQRTSE